VLHLDDAAGSKTNAMVTRYLPRDFIDVASVLSRYSRSELMRLTFTRDPGLRVVDFTDAVRQLDHGRSFLAGDSAGCFWADVGTHPPPLIEGTDGHRCCRRSDL